MNYLAFKKFLASTGLSTRRFGDQCGIGKTTVHRLAQPLHGGLTAPYVRRITPAVMDACRRHLESAGAEAGTVHRHLTEIFGDDFKPMINHRILLTPEVLAFFGLARDPFAAPRSPAELFTTPAIESVYAQLEQAVKFQGFVCLLAPVGAGKTMLKNRLLAALSPRSNVQSPKSEAHNSPPDSGGVAAASADGVVGASTGCTAGDSPAVVGATRPHMNAQRSKDFGPWTLDFGPASMVISPKFVDVSRVTAAGIVAYVLEELGVKPRRALVLAQKQLEQRLAHLAQNDITVALCFDECHHLNDALLTALKNFYELGTGGFERHLGLILFGQPPFAARLGLPRFREIAERLACLELPAFPVETAENYLAHCLASPRSQVQGPKSEEGCTSPHVSKGESLNPSNEIQNPKSKIQNGNDPGSLFEPEAIRLIAARASTPLGIANAAAAAMLEAYKKGERCVLARFVPDGKTEPKAMRIRVNSC